MTDDALMDKQRQPFRSNCFWYVIRQWMTHRGYVVVYRSHFGWWPHFLWSSDQKTFYEFMPTAPKRRKILPPLWFHGHVRVWHERELDAVIVKKIVL